MSNKADKKKIKKKAPMRRRWELHGSRALLRGKFDKCSNYVYVLTSIEYMIVLGKH